MAVDWKAPETVAANAVSFAQFLHAMMGLYIWEFVTSIDFDFQFITGARRFRWPLIPYFYGRYAMLIGLIGFIVSLDTKTEIDCQTLYIILQVLGNTALGVASVNLAIRTVAIWGGKRYISIPLIILILGQFAIIFRSCANVSAIYIPGTGCATTHIDSEIFAVMYIYTMIVDLIVLLLTLWKLVVDSSARGYPGVVKRSPIVTLLFKDGLIYFVVAFVGNLIAVIFSLMKLNDVMALIADIPATTFATIAACRCVRRLNNYVAGESVQVYNTNASAPKFKTTAESRPIPMATFSATQDLEANTDRKLMSDSAEDLEVKRVAL